MVDSVAPVTANFEEASAPQGAYLIYTVPTDPTLDSILINFQMSRKEMAFLNPDVNIDQLDPGQKITILAPPLENLPIHTPPQHLLQISDKWP